MATQPNFTSTAHVGSIVLSSTAETSYTAPTHAVAVFVAGGSGSKVYEIDYVGTGTTLAGIVQLYLFDGAAYHAFDSFVISAVTPSTTQAPFRQAVPYPNLILPSGWTLYAASFVASQLINVVALGGDA